MKNEIYHNILIYNSQLVEKDSIDEINLSDGVIVYEVIRVIDGIPLFLEDHMSRLNESANLAGFEININNVEINSSIRQLSIENQTLNGNIKLMFQFKKNHKLLFLCYFIKHNYPDDSEYQHGVKTILFTAERSNPLAKINDFEFRQITEEIISNKKVYEVLLVNRNGLITEGSKSNVFFIKDNIIYTAPENIILQGITRKYVIETAYYSQMEIVEKSVNKKDIKQFDSVFLTGTSPKILPVSSIGNINYDVNHPLLRKLMNEFEEEIDNYFYRIF
ncbi:MAG: aminotransferase class IV [Bacteroidales bacterium]